MVRPFIASPPVATAARSPEHVWSIRQFQDIERVLKIYAEEIEKNKADILQQNASQDPAEGAQ